MSFSQRPVGDTTVVYVASVVALPERPPSSYLRPQGIARIQVRIDSMVTSVQPPVPRTTTRTTMDPAVIRRTVVAFNGLPRSYGPVGICTLMAMTRVTLTFIRRAGTPLRVVQGGGCSRRWITQGPGFPALELDGTDAFDSAVTAIVGTRNW